MHFFFSFVFVGCLGLFVSAVFLPCVSFPVIFARTVVAVVVIVLQSLSLLHWANTLTHNLDTWIPCAYKCCAYALPFAVPFRGARFLQFKYVSILRKWTRSRNFICACVWHFTFQCVSRLLLCKWIRCSFEPIASRFGFAHKVNKKAWKMDEVRSFLFFSLHTPYSLWIFLRLHCILVSVFFPISIRKIRFYPVLIHICQKWLIIN